MIPSHVWHCFRGQIQFRVRSPCQPFTVALPKKLAKADLWRCPAPEPGSPRHCSPLRQKPSVHAKTLTRTFSERPYSMVHLSIPGKLKGSSRAGTPVPSRSSTPRPDEQRQASKSPLMPLVLQFAVLQVRNDSST